MDRIVIPKEIRRTLRIREGQFLGSSPHAKSHAHPGYETGWAWCCMGILRLCHLLCEDAGFLFETKFIKGFFAGIHVFAWLHIITQNRIFS